MKHVKKYWFIVAIFVVFGFAASIAFEKKIPIVDAQSTNGVSPAISDVKVKEVEATSTTIDWTTDAKSDSVVNYGTTKNLGTAKGPNPSLTSHETVIEDLDPATQYFFRISSADSAGNRSFSPTFGFTTPGTVNVPNISKISNAEQKQLT